MKTLAALVLVDVNYDRGRPGGIGRMGRGSSRTVAGGVSRRMRMHKDFGEDFRMCRLRTGNGACCITSPGRLLVRGSGGVNRSNCCGSFRAYIIKMVNSRNNCKPANGCRGGVAIDGIYIWGGICDW